MAVPLLFVASFLCPLQVQQDNHGPIHVDPPVTRFAKRTVLAGLDPITVDTRMTGSGFATEVAKSYGLEGRVLWIDATANLDKVNSEDKVMGLVSKIKQVGFNTIVFDVKPISGQTLYPSKFAPRMALWRNVALPASFDPLKIMVREAHLQGLSLIVSINAFSEGHRDFKVGPGYVKPEWQTVLYDAKPLIVGRDGFKYPMWPKLDEMPKDDLTVGVFDDFAKVPPPAPNQHAVLLDRDGTVLAILPQGQLPPPPYAQPKDTTVVVGTGAAAQFLKERVVTGIKATYDVAADFVPIGQRPELQVPLMVNPNNPEVRAYALSILKEIAENYAVDGVIYDDRLRYANLGADFSPLTRGLFENYVGKKLTWPDDVFKFTTTRLVGHGVVPGPYFDAWMTWRAMVIRNYLAEARSTLKAARPSAILAVYAGSWYGEYPALGNNWASPDFDAGFWFLTPAYRQTGIAPLVDLMITGCYYPTSTIVDAMATDVGIGNCIEASGDLSTQAVRDQAWTYAGIDPSSFKDNPVGLENALQAAIASTQGVMVFDLSHDMDKLWPIFEKAFSVRKRPPHGSATALAQVRRKRLVADRSGKKDPTIVIASGSAGIGQ